MSHFMLPDDDAPRTSLGTGQKTMVPNDTVVSEPDGFAPDAHECHYITLSVPGDWEPNGPRTRHPQGGEKLSYANACRVAALMNLERIQKRPGKVLRWSVVAQYGRGHYVLDIDTQRKGHGAWKPESLTDLPETVKVVHLSKQGFVEWLTEKNARQIVREQKISRKQRGRCWTVRIIPVDLETLLDQDSQQPVNRLLKTIDEMIFQLDLKQKLKVSRWDLAVDQARSKHGDAERSSREASSSLEASQVGGSGLQPPLVVDDREPAISKAVGSTRRYRLGMFDGCGTMQPISDPLPQAEALEMLDRLEQAGAVLLPVESGPSAGSGVTA